MNVNFAERWNLDANCLTNGTNLKVEEHEKGNIIIMPKIYDFVCGILMRNFTSIHTKVIINETYTNHYNRRR